ncbi:serine--tRNA ligase [Pseudoroseomonas rhizosphaerae]|uniref:Serine--tRNA ligase n=1 Tax=Teichococcus rhizosphaerae TaxID=1335062 RepID=A0A2C7A902_9PROT|nr:serine--tRNA ligase [Pseudoroseomonas rhizosphaerae]PHK96598.1 serine--tRNA ligase [Pseudoroseomonas rhizosphaerae]
MHDIRIVRADPAGFDAALARRGLPPSAEAILAQDAARRAAQAAAQEAQSRRNQLSKEIGQARRQGADTAALESEGAALRDRMEALADEAKAAEVAQTAMLEALPNLLDPAVPEGRDEADNVVLRQHGEPPALDFTPKQHFEIGEALGLMDFGAAAKLAGARFTVLRGALARLERALGQYMIALHTEEHGYTETSVPLLVNDATMYGTGQLPKFSEDLFRTTDGRWLIPTAEVPLTNLVAGEILAESALPLRFTALSPCFRSEAGSAGRDTRGMLRQHQFTKAEMVAITRPEDSAAEHERMTQCAERVLTELGLVWRRVVLCAGDTGFSATKTYDLEVWLPGQGAWREISSCSNCGDFQARRMNARYRPEGGKGTAFLHTLNGSGVAVGRALIAVLETHQQADGGVRVPEVLRPWMGGLERIG